MSDFTIVIQGPQHSKSISAGNVHNYLQYGEVIVSHWAGGDVAGFEGIPGVRIVSQPTPTVNAVNGQNIYYQCMSSIKGLQDVKTEFAIKARSDEAYTDLSPIVNEVLAAPDKMVTNNIYCRRDREFKLHASDHIIAGRTRALLETFWLLKKALESFDGTISNATAEQKIFNCFLRYHGVAADPARSKDILRQWLCVVPISRLGSVIWSDWMGPHREPPTGYSATYINSVDDMVRD